MAELTLEVVEGPDAGRRIDVTAPVEVGREEGVALVLADQLVSRRHARLTPVQGGVRVEDLGSRNGTFLNGNEVHGPVVATPGDQVLVGGTVLQLRSAAQVAERPSAVRPVPAGLATPPQTPDYLPPELRAASPGAAAGGRRDVPIPDLDPLLDVHTKRRAVLAPLAVLAVAALAIIVFLAAR